MGTQRLGLWQRLRFALLGKSASGHEVAVWTDGDWVRWRVNNEDGHGGVMPVWLFKSAALRLASDAEQRVLEDSDDPDKGDDALNEAHNRLEVPLAVAAADPLWRDEADLAEINDPHMNSSAWVAGVDADCSDALKMPAWATGSKERGA